MTETPQMRHRLLAACTLFALTLSLAGCGDSTGLAKRYSVSGTVTYKGQPLESGVIEFHPTNLETQRSAFGSIEDGDYYLTTAIDGDGALPGDYNVAIKAKEPVDYSKAEGNVQGGSLRQDDVAAAIKDAKDLIPTKYSIPQTSGLKFTVQESSNRGANFDLTD